MTAALIVMYHYVRPYESDIPGGIRPLLVSEFQTQLDWLGARYDIVGAVDFLDRLQSPAHRPACLLTFDDGTKDHAEIVTPILARRGLSGVFFVLSGPAQRGIMPLAHGMHWLLGGDEQLIWEMFQQQAGQSLGDPVEAMRIYNYETPLRARIKYAANMVLPNQVTGRIIEAAVKAAGRTIDDLAREWFVSADDIQAMDAAGMTVAIHGVTHRSLQSLGPAGIRDEIHRCSNYLMKLTGKSPAWYACPFGGSGATDQSRQAMRSAMTACGIIASVSTEKAYVPASCDRLALPRLDTIDLPPRQAVTNR